MPSSYPKFFFWKKRFTNNYWFNNKHELSFDVISPYIYHHIRHKGHTDYTSTFFTYNLCALCALCGDIYMVK